jgi:hypothetical protein
MTPHASEPPAMEQQQDQTIPSPRKPLPQFLSLMTTQAAEPPTVEHQEEQTIPSPRKALPQSLSLMTLHESESPTGERQEDQTTPSPRKTLSQLLALTEEESRPPTIRRSTEPDMSPNSPFLNKPLPFRTRNRSPYARSHLRSHSSASSLSVPPMTRAHSSPIVDSFGHFHMATSSYRPSSPRRVSPLRRPLESEYPTPTSASGYTHLDIEETISENHELDLTPRSTIQETESFPSPSPSIHHTFPRSRRRPSSPLYNIVQPGYNNNNYSSPSPLHTSVSSPTLATKFNESYPSSLSSVPSTPTSFRSRSPSISSLETIPDSPDAEEAAQEEDAITRLKDAADREEREGRPSRRGSLGGEGGRSGGRGGDKRKRWSVCGAERRGDLDLETIWED